MSVIEVSVEIEGETVRIGDLYSSVRRGRLSSSFAYLPEYLRDSRSYALEPALPLNSGTWAVATEMPGSFADASPDRWGRNLIRSRARAEALARGDDPPSLDARHYLLGVSDVTRQGALRFRADRDGGYLAADHRVPKLIALPELLRAADAVARSELTDHAAVKTLLDAGTASLGGARPKASVVEEGVLYIAKFPHPSDRWSVIKWESCALELARRSGVAAPESRLIDINDVAVLLVERFDRVWGNRIGYMSAMTLLESRDGDRRDYLDIADRLTEVSDDAQADLHELWRRAAFSVAIHNTDDHLRNHGLLRGRAGWRLSPVFDVNPNPDLAAQRVTSIGGAEDARAELRVLLEYAPLFGLVPDAARAVLADVVSGLRDWRAVAAESGISDAEVNDFADVFDRGRAVLSG